MKLGRTFPAVVRALSAAGRLEHAMYVERASQEGERWLPVTEVDPSSVPYFSLIVVPGDSVAGDPGGRRVSTGSTGADRACRDLGTPELLVVGLGPGPSDWQTPEVTAALAEVDHVVGYAPYVNRVPQRPGLRRHSSGNTVEVDRAAFALGLALSGERVAVVSGGDAGVFGMASAVFEAAEDERYAAVPVRVLPGMTAVQAVAARAGAPLGGDFAVLSLSDRLKPWPVIERRLAAVAEADLVLAVYNPASRSRITQVAEMQRILLQHRDPGTVVVVGRDVGREGESLEVTTLGGLDAASIDMRCLLIVGSSGTTVSPAGRVWTRRSVH
jgi:precorrin-2 C20-methyltransferase/precorrin-3B C17-methyltransferase